MFSNKLCFSSGAFIWLLPNNKYTENYMKLPSFHAFTNHSFYVSFRNLMSGKCIRRDVGISSQQVTVSANSMKTNSDNNWTFHWKQDSWGGDCIWNKDLSTRTHLPIVHIFPTVPQPACGCVLYKQVCRQMCNKIRDFQNKKYHYYNVSINQCYIRLI